MKPDISSFLQHYECQHALLEPYTPSRYIDIIFYPDRSDIRCLNAHNTRLVGYRHNEQAYRVHPVERSSPLIDIESFPREFTPCVRRPLWKRFLYGRLGFVTIATKEPQPLAYSSNQALASTDCNFEIAIECDSTSIR